LLRLLASSLFWRDTLARFSVSLSLSLSLSLPVLLGQQTPDESRVVAGWMGVPMTFFLFLSNRFWGCRETPTSRRSRRCAPRFVLFFPFQCIVFFLAVVAACVFIFCCVFFFFFLGEWCKRSFLVWVEQRVRCCAVAGRQPKRSAETKNDTYTGAARSETAVTVRSGLWGCKAVWDRSIEKTHGNGPALSDGRVRTHGRSGEVWSIN